MDFEGGDSSGCDQPGIGDMAVAERIKPAENDFVCCGRTAQGTLPSFQTPQDLHQRLAITCIRDSAHTVSVVDVKLQMNLRLGPFLP